MEWQGDSGGIEKVEQGSEDVNLMTSEEMGVDMGSGPSVKWQECLQETSALTRSLISGVIAWHINGWDRYCWGKGKCCGCLI